MGNSVGRVKCNVTMIGLDMAGKTSIVSVLKNQVAAAETTPSIGFYYEVIKKGRLRLTIYDVAGQDDMRHLWMRYIRGVHMIILVIDSSDRMRDNLIANEVIKLLEAPNEELTKMQWVILSNKQDVSTSIPGQELIEKIGIEQKFKELNVKYKVFDTIAIGPKLQGLDKARDYILKELKKKFC